MTKIVVEDERVFPTLGIIAQAGDEVRLPEEDVVIQSSKTKKVSEVKEGDSDGSTSL